MKRITAKSMPRPAYVLAALCLGVAGASASPTTEKLAAAHLTGAEISALRGNSSGRAWIVDLTIHTAKKRRDLAAAQSKHATLVLGPDYAAIRQDGTTEVWDRKLRRRFIRVDAKGEFTNYSTVADVHFRISEFLNRVHLTEMIKRAGAKDLPKETDLFWLQSAFGLTHGDLKWVEPKIVRKSGVLRISYKDEPVAEIRPGSDAHDAATRRGFVSVLRYKAAMHPLILAEIEALDGVPERLEFLTSDNDFADVGWARWEIGAMRPGTEDFPIKAGDRPNTLRVWTGNESKDGFLVLALPIVEQAARGTYGKGAPTFDLLLLRFEDLTDKGRVFDAFLLLAAELGQLFPEEFNRCPQASEARLCRAIKRMNAISGQDPRFDRYLRALNLGQSANREDRAKAVEVWQSISLEGLDYGYAVKLGYANTLVTQGKTGAPEVWEGFLAALKAMPYNPNTYRDIGNVYNSSYQMQIGWLFYDIGRTLPNRPSRDLLTTIAELERNLVKDFPQFF